MIINNAAFANDADNQSFVCYEEEIDPSDSDSPLAVQEGDILGACISNPMGRDKALNILGEVEGESLLSTSLKRNCYKSNGFPSTVTIPNNPTATAESLRLHLYANIGLFSYHGCIAY